MKKTQTLTTNNHIFYFLFFIWPASIVAGIHVTSFSVFHTEATVYLGYPGSQKRSLRIPDRSRHLIQWITENGLGYARSPVHFPNHPLHPCLSTPWIGALLNESDCHLLVRGACSRDLIEPCCGPWRVSARCVRVADADFSTGKFAHALKCKIP